MSELACSLSSAFLHQGLPPLTYTFKLPITNSAKLPITPFLANFGFADHPPRIVGILRNGLVLARKMV